MSFSDWTAVVSGTATATWEAITPIQGSHSYSVNESANSSSTFCVGYRVGISANCGKFRVLNKQTNVGLGNWGVFANIQTALALGNSAYGAFYNPGSGLVAIYKGSITNMIGGSVTGQVATSSWGGTQQTLNSVYAMEIHWQQDPISGNIILDMSLDGPIASPNTYDYSTLVTMVSYTDNSAVYSSGITSGFYGSNGGTAFGGTTRKMYDVAQMYTD